MSTGTSQNVETRLQWLRQMLRIRGFEQRIEARFAAGDLTGTFHSSEGQEAVAVGVCAALRPEDLAGSSHRGHGHFIAKGGDLKRIAAELFGRATGYSAGRGGTQHMAGADVGFLGSNGITGGGIPVATGAALALKQRNEPQVVVSFFGDGASNQGAFHESLNMAAIWRLPILYVCENNQFAMGSHVRDMVSVEDIADRGAAYGIPARVVDGNDVAAVAGAAGELLAEVRGHSGPRLLECKTWRVRGHSKSDAAAYRCNDEHDAWRRRDPIVALQTALCDEGVAQEQLDALQSDVDAELDAAFAEAEAAERGGPAVALSGVYSTPLQADADDPAERPAGETRDAFFWEGIQTALREALAEDDSVFCYGEDIGAYGGAFKVTRGMLEEFGPSRIVDTPISENGIVGTAVGAAMQGRRPVVEIMFMDFLLLAFDQLINHAAKFHYIYNGQYRVPLTLRVPSGGYRGYGATHSQCLEGMLMGVPGLKVVAPSTPREARGLLRAAIRDDDPVVFIEHKLLYGRRGDLPVAPEILPLGRARRVRIGDDVTLIAYGWMLQLCLKAADELAGEGIEADVIDLRTLAPLDAATLAESAARTQRVVVVEEAPRTAGVGSEVAALLQEQAFGYLDAPILRVAAAPAPVPAAADQERAVLPSVASILNAARNAVEGDF